MAPGRTTTPRLSSGGRGTGRGGGTVTSQRAVSARDSRRARRAPSRQASSGSAKSAAAVDAVAGALAGNCMAKVSSKVNRPASSRRATTACDTRSHRVCPVQQQGCAGTAVAQAGGARTSRSAFGSTACTRRPLAAAPEPVVVTGPVAGRRKTASAVRVVCYRTVGPFGGMGHAGLGQASTCAKPHRRGMYHQRRHELVAEEGLQAGQDRREGVAQAGHGLPVVGELQGRVAQRQQDGLGQALCQVVELAVQKRAGHRLPQHGHPLHEQPDVLCRRPRPHPVPVSPLPVHQTSRQDGAPRTAVGALAEDGNGIGKLGRARRCKRRHIGVANGKAVHQLGRWPRAERSGCDGDE